MWKNWFLGFVGLWLIALGFSGFPSQILKILIIISGVAVALVSFKNVSRHKVAESVKHLDELPRGQEPENIEDNQQSTGF